MREKRQTLDTWSTSPRRFGKRCVHIHSSLFIVVICCFIIISLHCICQHMISQSPPASPSSSENKTLSRVTNEPSSPRHQSEEREPTPPPSSADEEWVEYVDSFGRSRRCLRKDLPQFMKLDQQTEAKREETKKERKRLVHHFYHIISRIDVFWYGCSNV